MEAVQTFEQEHYQEAMTSFKGLRTHYPELNDYVLYFLGHVSLKLNKKPAAFAAFQEFLQSYSSHPLRYEVQFEFAHLLFDRGDYRAARDRYRQLLGHPEIVPEGDAYYRLGKVFLALNQPDEAAFSFQQMVSFYVTHPKRKDVQQQLDTLYQHHPELRPNWTEGDRLRQARAFMKARWYQSARAEYEAIIQQYPDTAYREECEIAIADASFRLGQSQKGMKYLRQLIKEYKRKEPVIAARALYIIGSKQWNSDYNTAAQKTMQQVLKDYEHTSWADNATYVTGRIFQGEKHYQEAAEWYLRVYERYPGSRFAEESLWRAGWCYYLDAQYEHAVQTFSQASVRFARDGGLVEDTLYWLGRTQERQKKHNEAIATYRKLLRYNSGSYYSLLAEQRLTALNSPVPPPPRQKASEPAMSELLARMQHIFPDEVYAQIRPHLAKVFELRRVNRRRYAKKETEWIVSLIGDGSDLFETRETRNYSLEFRYCIARLFAVAGDYLKTIQWAARLESTLRDTEQNRRFTYRLETFPYRLDSLKYPLGYWDEILRYADANSLDPFLIAALIRQESAYNPEARSWADARGLMQIIPGTGKRLAKRLKVKNFKVAQLFEPELNIRFGTAYLAGLLQDFDGNVFRALAAYNAGPAATTKWWNANSPDDQEVIVENISYRETRKYVKRVLRNYAHYTKLYRYLLKQ